MVIRRIEKNGAEKTWTRHVGLKPPADYFFKFLFVLVVQAWRGKFSPEYNAPIDMMGLYWHFVDIVWIFLFPLLYLVLCPVLSPSLSCSRWHLLR